jgi:hypothetical protein
MGHGMITHHLETKFWKKNLKSVLFSINIPIVAAPIGGLGLTTRQL